MFIPQLLNLTQRIFSSILMEKVNIPSEIKHKIFKELLMMQDYKDHYQIEITTGYPAGTGLGSSGHLLFQLSNPFSILNIILINL